MLSQPQALHSLDLCYGVSSHTSFVGDHNKLAPTEGYTAGVQVAQGSIFSAYILIALGRALRYVLLVRCRITVHQPQRSIPRA